MAGGWLGVGGFEVGGLGIGGFGAGALGVGAEWANSRHCGLSRAMALHVEKSVEKPLRFSAFLSVRPKFVSGHPTGKSLMGMRATWPAQRRTRPWY